MPDASECAVKRLENAREPRGAGFRGIEVRAQLAVGGQV
jgi:hypothetical protein